MVGTAVYQVAFVVAAQSRNESGSKPGVHTTLAPARMLARSAATRPWMWNSGMTLRHRSPAVSWTDAATLAADVRRFVWDSGTVFGRAVVPDVCNTRAMSSPARAAGLVVGDAVATRSSSETQGTSRPSTASTRAAGGSPATTT